MRTTVADAFRVACNADGPVGCDDARVIHSAVTRRETSRACGGASRTGRMDDKCVERALPGGGRQLRSPPS